MKETICFECGNASLAINSAPFAGQRNGEPFTVEVPGLVCPACGFATLDSAQSEIFTRAISDAYRKAHGLLTGNEMRTIRAKANMSQQEFADYLGVGVASIKRWELGQIQDKAMDELMRLKSIPAFARRNADEVSQLFGAPIVEVWAPPTGRSWRPEKSRFQPASLSCSLEQIVGRAGARDAA